MNKLVTILLLTSVAVTGCVLSTQTPPEEKNEPVSQLEEIDTSDWKIYRNEEFGFEFRYSDEWEMNEKDNMLIYPNVQAFAVTLLKNGPTQSEGSEFYDGRIFRVNIFKVFDNKTLAGWVNYLRDTEIETRQIKFQGVESIATEDKFIYGENVINNSSEKTISFIKEGNFYQITLFSIGDRYKEYLEDLEQILKTFKS